MRQIRTVALTLSAAIGIAALGATSADAAQTFGGNVRYSWSVSGAPAQGLADLSFPMTLNATTAHLRGTYVAADYKFMNQSKIGYMGLQPRPDFRGRGEAVAIFSTFVPGSTTTDPQCRSGADNGPGVSCSTAIPMVYGHRYDVQIKRIATDTWQGTVTDSVSGASNHVGTYVLPAGSGGIRPSQVGFVENFSTTGCNAIQKVDTSIGRPQTTTGTANAFTNVEHYGNCLNTPFTFTQGPDRLRIERGVLNPALQAVKSITSSGTSVNVTLDAAVANGGYRVIVRVDNRWTMESYSGSVYGGSSSSTSSTKTISATVETLHSGSDVDVYLAPNLPGEDSADAYNIAEYTVP